MLFFPVTICNMCLSLPVTVTTEQPTGTPAVPPSTHLPRPLQTNLAPALAPPRPELARGRGGQGGVRGVGGGVVTPTGAERGRRGREEQEQEVGLGGRHRKVVVWRRVEGGSLEEGGG